MRKLFFIACLLVPWLCRAKKRSGWKTKQLINELIRQEEEGVITYYKHTAFGFKLYI
jgi:hypothetical protein